MSKDQAAAQLSRLIAEIDFESERYYNLYFESADELPPPDVSGEAWTSLSSLTVDMTKIRGELSRLRRSMEQLQLPAAGAAGLDRVAEQLRGLEARLHPRREEPSRPEEKDQVRRVLKYLLGVADALDRVQDLAQAQPGAVSEGVRRGLESVRQLLLECFGRQGLEPMEVGQAFDPHLHLAMGTEPHPELPEGAISRVLLKGYLLGGHVFRTAQVVVVKGSQR